MGLPIWLEADEKKMAAEDMDYYANQFRAFVAANITMQQLKPVLNANH